MENSFRRVGDAEAIDNVKHRRGCCKAEWNRKHDGVVQQLSSLTYIRRKAFSFSLSSANTDIRFHLLYGKYGSIRAMKCNETSSTHAARAFICVLWWLCAERDALLAHLGKYKISQPSSGKKWKTAIVFHYRVMKNIFPALDFLFQLAFNIFLHASLVFRENRFPFNVDSKWNWNRN